MISISVDKIKEAAKLLNDINENVVFVLGERISDLHEQLYILAGYDIDYTEVMDTITDNLANFTDRLDDVVSLAKKNVIYIMSNIYGISINDLVLNLPSEGDEWLINGFDDLDIQEDGAATVVNGVFYLPSSSRYNGSDVARGSGPDGYNIVFFNRLSDLLDACYDATGYRVGYGKNAGGFRSYSQQEYLYNNNPPGMANYPGTSMHGWGIASDLEPINGVVSDEFKKALKWCHENAKRFNLEFTYGDVEDWHVQIPKMDIVYVDKDPTVKNVTNSDNSSIENNHESSSTENNQNSNNYEDDYIDNIDVNDNDNHDDSTNNDVNVNDDNFKDNSDNDSIETLVVDDAINNLESTDNVYVVQNGQSLSSIANELGTTWEELYAKNKDTISDPNNIYAGQELKY